MTPDLFGEIDPPQRLLMGPGPVNAHPRVLRAMSADLLGQFDPEMTAYMNQVMALYRPIFGTRNRWTMLIDGTARAAIEAALVSLIAPGVTSRRPTVATRSSGRAEAIRSTASTASAAAVKASRRSAIEVVPA